MPFAWYAVKLQGGGWQGCQYRDVRPGTVHCTRRAPTDPHGKSGRGTVNSRPSVHYFILFIYYLQLGRHPVAGVVTCYISTDYEG